MSDCFVDHVAEAVDEVGVVAVAAGHRVVVDADQVEQVVAAAAVQRVVAFEAAQLVVAGAGSERVAENRAPDAFETGDRVAGRVAARGVFGSDVDGDRAAAQCGS